MIKKDSFKKNLPILLLVIAIILVITITAVVGAVRNHQNPSIEEGTVDDEVNFIDGIIPEYKHVPKNKYDYGKFSYDENGRMTYTGLGTDYQIGIDVSTYQENIDWEKVKKDNIDFAFIRIGGRGYGERGVLYTDENWKKNVDNAKKAGIEVGVYFYSQAITEQEAVDEAKYVIKELGGEKLTYPVVFDWENEADYAMRTDGTSSEVLTKCAVAFCDTIREAGYTPMIYFNLHSAYTKYNLSEIKDEYIWFSEYGNSHPSYYYHFDIWQYTNSGSVDGIDGDVDMNISFKDFNK